MADKENDQPSLATLEREGVRLHHCLASEGLSDRDEDAAPDRDSPPKKERKSGI